jgi:hypothetical protein
MLSPRVGSISRPNSSRKSFRDILQEVATMDVDKASTVISAAGIELTDRRRNSADDGWSLSFSNGAVLDVRDNGEVSASGKGAEAVASLLGLPGKPSVG